MDVIDLCDDDNDSVEPTSQSNKSTILLQNLPITTATNDGPHIVIKEESPPSKPILKVIAIEKLKRSAEDDERVTVAKRTSRRKSILQPKVQDNDSIEFLDESSSTSEILVAGPEGDDSTNQSNRADDLVLNLDDVPNPNIELMRRVAFLRVSIQHTLKELGLDPVKFERNSSWGHLRAQYMQNKKNREKKNNETN